MGGCLSAGPSPYSSQLAAVADQSAARLEADGLKGPAGQQRSSAASENRERPQRLSGEGRDSVAMLDAVLNSRQFRSAGEVRRYVSQMMGPPGSTPIARDHVIALMSAPMRDVVERHAAQFDESPTPSLDSRNGSPRTPCPAPRASRERPQKDIPEGNEQGEDV